MEHFRPELLDLTTLVPVLNRHHLLTQSENYDLLNRLISPIERANALVYTMLPSKGPEAFVLFIKCLQEEKEHVGHQELAKQLSIPVPKECKCILQSCLHAYMKVHVQLTNCVLYSLH